MQKSSTPEYAREMLKRHVEKHGLIPYFRRIKPEFKEALDKFLAELRNKEV